MSANFEELISKVKTCGKKKVSVAVAQDAPILEAVEEARKQGFADAILVGDEEKIRAIAAELNIDLAPYEIINEPDNWQAALKDVYKRQVPACRHGNKGRGCTASGLQGCYG